MNMAHVHAAGRHEKDGAAGDQPLQTNTRKGGRVERSLGDRHVTGRAGKFGEIGICDGVLVDPEAADGGFMGRALFGIRKIRGHAERAARDPPHARRVTLCMAIESSLAPGVAATIGPFISALCYRPAGLCTLIWIKRSALLSCRGICIDFRPAR